MSTALGIAGSLLRQFFYIKLFIKTEGKRYMEQSYPTCLVKAFQACNELQKQDTYAKLLQNFLSYLSAYYKELKVSQ